VGGGSDVEVSSAKTAVCGVKQTLWYQRPNNMLSSSVRRRRRRRRKEEEELTRAISWK
jgi:hypothetical protein